MHDSNSTIFADGKAVPKRPLPPKNKNPAYINQDIPQLIRDLKRKAHNGDELTIRGAFIIRELRRRVERGDEGEITWLAWGRKNLGLGKTRLTELHSIACAENPKGKLDQIKLLRIRRRQDFESKRANLDSVRRNLAKFAMHGDIEKVRHLEAFRQRMGGRS